MACSELTRSECSDEGSVLRRAKILQAEETPGETVSSGESKEQNEDQVVTYLRI